MWFCAISSFFLFFNLIKTAAKFMRNESVKCPVRVRYLPSREPGTCILCHSISQFTYKSKKSTDLNYSISRVSYVHSSRATDESLHYFVLPSEKPKRFRSLCRLRIPANIVSRTQWFWVRDCTQELIPLDISYDQIFCKDRHKTLKYVDKFPE